MQDKFEHLLEVCSLGNAQLWDDSRKVSAGCNGIFVAVPGASMNGGEFIDQAIANGAKYVVCREEELDSLSSAGTGECEIIFHNDPREALWRLARASCHMEKPRFKIIGITGTNGKTTSAFLLEHIFSSAGCKVGVLGTVSYRWPDVSIPAPLTTPGPLELYSMLAQMEKAGVDVVVMEVSSHALSQRRVSGLSFSGALFTNLTQDHLDYHKDMESYFRAKSKLFMELPGNNKVMAINGDDSYGRRLLELLPQALSFGLHSGMPGSRHLRGEILSNGMDGIKMRMNLEGKKWEIHSPLVGIFNAQNLLGVQALATQMGLDAENFSCLENFHGVSGRLERIPNNRGLNIFVDYAHTPDALINALKALRDSGFRNIVTVFGCGGNRDRAKRPLMGRAVAEYSDVAILTSDNPRMEEPQSIMLDVKPGLAKAKRVYTEVDRRKATAMAIDLLGPDDALLVAGKGHEDYQIIGTTRIHYSDQEVIRELLQCA